jgi:hypothetical protein
VTSPGLSFGRWPGPPAHIVVHITNKLLVYREHAIRQYAQMAYSGAPASSASAGLITTLDAHSESRRRALRSYGAWPFRFFFEVGASPETCRRRRPVSVVAN